MLPRHLLAGVIRTSVEEDIGAWDITTGAALKGDETGLARATAKAEMIVAGADAVLLDDMSLAEMASAVAGSGGGFLSMPRET